MSCFMDIERLERVENRESSSNTCTILSSIVDSIESAMSSSSRLYKKIVAVRRRRTSVWPLVLVGHFLWRQTSVIAPFADHPPGHRLPL